MGLGRLAFVVCAGSLASALLVEDTQHANRTAAEQPPDPAGVAGLIFAGLVANLAAGFTTALAGTLAAAGVPTESLPLPTTLAKMVTDMAAPAPAPGAVKVLVFGDWWTNVGVGPGLLEQLFEQRNIPLHIRHVRGHRMGACNQAETPSTLADKIKAEFGEEVPDYVWYTAGGYDLIHPGERAFKSDKCPHESREPTEADAVACLKAFTTEDMNKCTDKLLLNMWENPLYSNVKVVQLGYDFPCMEGNCKKAQPKDVYCKGQDSCHRKQLMHWNEFALGKEFHEFKGHGAKYTGINILGAMQSAHPKIGGIGAEPGRPNLEKGSPCADTTMCLWPKKGSAGYRAITNAFWDKYWSLENLDELVKCRAAESVKAAPGNPVTNAASPSTPTNNAASPSTPSTPSTPANSAASPSTPGADGASPNTPGTSGASPNTPGTNGASPNTPGTAKTSPGAASPGFLKHIPTPVETAN